MKNFASLGAAGLMALSGCATTPPSTPKTAESPFTDAEMANCNRFMVDLQAIRADMNFLCDTENVDALIAETTAACAKVKPAEAKQEINFVNGNRSYRCVLEARERQARARRSYQEAEKAQQQEAIANCCLSTQSAAKSLRQAQTTCDFSYVQNKRCVQDVNCAGYDCTYKIYSGEPVPPQTTTDQIKAAIDSCLSKGRRVIDADSFKSESAEREVCKPYVDAHRRRNRGIDIDRAQWR